MKRQQWISLWVPGSIATLLAVALIWAATDFWTVLRSEPAHVSTVAAFDNPAGSNRPASGSDYSLLRQSPIFGIPQAKAPAPVPQRIPETRARLTLHGVIVDGPRSGAIVGEQGGRQQFVPVGGETTGGLVLQEVHADRVVLERQGESELLRFPAVPSVLRPQSPRAADEVKTPQQTSSLDFGAPSVQWQQHVRVIKFHKEGRFQGYRVLPGTQPQLYKDLELEPEDVVVAMNGEPVRDEASVESFAEKLVSGSATQVRILRGDRVIDLRRPGAAPLETAVERGRPAGRDG